MQQKRIKPFDIAKGIGVILVLIGHMPRLITVNMKMWIDSFHIPLFFLCSGYFAEEIVARDELRKSLCRIVKKFCSHIFYTLLCLFCWIRFMVATN